MPVTFLLDPRLSLGNMKPKPKLLKTLPHANYKVAISSRIRELRENLVGPLKYPESGKVGISYGSNPIVPGEKVLAMFDDHEADAMKVRDLDDLIHDALYGKKFRATKRAIRFFQRQVVVGFADVAFLPNIFSDEKLSNQERVESLDHVAKAENQLFSRFVLGQIFNGLGFARGLVVTQRSFDQFLAIARIGGR